MSDLSVLTSLTSPDGVYELLTASLPRTFVADLAGPELEDALIDEDVRRIAKALFNVEENVDIHSVPLTSSADILAFGLAFTYGSAVSLAQVDTQPNGDPLVLQRGVTFGYRVAASLLSREASVLQVTNTLLRGSGSPALPPHYIDELADLMLALETQPLVAEISSPPQLKELKSTAAAAGAAAAGVYYLAPEHGPSGLLLAAGTIVLVSMSVSIGRTVSKLIETLGDEAIASLQRKLRPKKKSGKSV